MGKICLGKLPGVYNVEYKPFTISDFENVPKLKLRYKSFYDLKEGDYLYIANRALHDIFFLKIEEIPDYVKYCSYSPYRRPYNESCKFFKKEEIIFFYWKSKENLKGEYGNGNKFASQYVYDPKRYSHIESYDWYNVDYNTHHFSDDSYICTTLEEAMNLLWLDDYCKQKSIKTFVLINIS